MSAQLILFACPDPFMSSYRIEVFENLGFQVVVIDNATGALQLLTGLGGKEPSLLIADSFLATGDQFTQQETYGGTETGVALYERIRRTDQKFPVIVFTTTRRTFEKIREIKDRHFLAIYDCAPNSSSAIIAGAQKLLATS